MNRRDLLKTGVVGIASTLGLLATGTLLVPKQEVKKDKFIESLKRVIVINEIEPSKPITTSIGYRGKDIIYLDTAPTPKLIITANKIQFNVEKEVEN